MPTHVAELDLPYTIEQVFDLIADIESYPQFLPHIPSARITHRNGNTIWVDQVVRFKILRLRFNTRTVLERPTRIKVVSIDFPFGTFNELWTFAERPMAGTHLRCCTDYAFRSSLLRLAMDAVLGELHASTMRLFAARAKKLYGVHVGASR